MHHEEFEPPEELRNTIKCFWYNCKEFGPAESAFDVVPDGYAEIIFHFGSGCSIIQNGLPVELPSPFMMGLLNQTAVFQTKNRFEVIGIRCFPWTVFDLLALPSGKGAARMIKHPIADLQSPLTECVEKGKIKDAIAYVAQHFIDAASQVAVDNTLSKAGTAMKQANGAIPVAQVAAAAHATVRTLERKFKQSSGHTVKDVAGLMRFEQVRNQLWQHPNANIAGLALEFGYTDQSHLSREFKRYSGMAPAAFARKTKIGQQGLTEDFVAFVQS